MKQVIGFTIVGAIIIFICVTVGLSIRNDCLSKKCPQGMSPQSLYGGSCICAVTPQE